MFLVMYFNMSTGHKEYRNYKNMEIQRVRALSHNYARKHNMQVITITKVY